MAMLTLNNIGVSFGDFDLFGAISVSIPNNGKIGLVGSNGIGKTTLLRVIAGDTPPSEGDLYFAKGTQFGYLEQESAAAFTDLENTIWQEMLTVFGDIRAQEEKLLEMEAKIADGHEELLATYGDLQQRFDHAGGYTYELSIKQTLSGLGFRDDQLQLPLNVLSGGQKTRALLARLLLEKPDLLILDEPTNHLDMEAIAWLEQTLHLWDGAMLIVSHDRYFLDRAVNTIWEMSRFGIEVYRGNYSTYVEQRQIRWEHRQETWDDEMERMYKEMDFIKKNWVRASTHDRAMGRLRILSREIVAIQQVGVMALKNTKWSQLGVGKVKPLGVQEAEQALKSLERPSNRPLNLNMRLKRPTRSGDMVLRTKNLEIGFPNVPLFKVRDDILLKRGEVAGIIGGNGTGKTTMLKTVLGTLQPIKGEIMLGASLEMGYFAQIHEMLQDTNTVLDEFIRHHPMNLSEARSILGRFLFRSDDVYKLVSMLSGGERARLALAVLANQRSNLLLLDEPTNHLDIPTQEVLQEVIENFDGTVLLVTHDRYLVDRLATQIWAVQDGALDVFVGTYQQYLGATSPDASASTSPAIAAAPLPEEPTADKPKLSKNELRRRQAKMQKLEDQIHALEADMEKTTLALQTASEAQDIAEVQRLSELYHTQEGKLEALMDEWGELGVEMS